MRTQGVLWAACACAGLGLAAHPAAPGRQGEHVRQTIESPFGQATFRIADLSGDGADELLLAAGDGRVAVYLHAERGADGPGEGGEAALLFPAPGEPLLLEDPERTLLALAPMLPGTGLDLVVLGPRGLHAHAFGPDGRPAPAVSLSRAARFRLRTGRPTFAAFVNDVNRDGLQDVVVPTGESCELWLQEEPGVAGAAGPAGTAAAGTPAAGGEVERAGVTLRRAATIAVEQERWGNREADALSFVLESSFSIPGLQTRDVNGDGRPDLTVVEGEKRFFHLQAADGSYPEVADVSLDLAIFRDTDFDGGVKPGQPLVVDAGATFEIRDLDGDGIPDYVIAHGRKVWVFLGTPQGPQFGQPASILRSAEDVTALTVLDLDEDERADLLLVKVQVPTVAAMIRGLLSEWDVHITTAGYRNAGGGAFETRAEWRSELTVRLPSLVRILRDPAEILRRFEDVGSRFRASAWADVDGDDSSDLLLVSEDEARIDVWRRRGGQDAGLDAERILRELLFGSTERVFDLDRAVMWLGNLADRRVAALTEGRAPDLSLPLRPRTEARLQSMLVGDFRGDGTEVLVLGYRAVSDGHLIIDLVQP